MQIIISGLTQHFPDNACEANDFTNKPYTTFKVRINASEERKAGDVALADRLEKFDSSKILPTDEFTVEKAKEVAEVEVLNHIRKVEQTIQEEDANTFFFDRAAIEERLAPKPAAPKAKTVSKRKTK